jgi:hypothetical protein
MRGALGLCRPNEETTDRVTSIEGLEETTHLVSIPDIAALELRQRHMAAVDVAENGRDLHVPPGSGRA